MPSYIRPNTLQYHSLNSDYEEPFAESDDDDVTLATSTRDFMCADETSFKFQVASTEDNWKWNSFGQRGVAWLLRAKEEMGQQLLAIQMVVCFLTMVCSACVFFPLAHITKAVGGDYCLLYAKVTLKWNGVKNVSVDDSLTVYDNAHVCKYCTYLHVSLAIASIIFLWFAIHSKVTKDNETGTGLRLLLPMVLFHVVIFFCLLVADVEITKGFSSWCNFIENNNLYRGQKYSCSEFEDFAWTPRGMVKIYTYSLMAEVCTWMVTFLVAIQCVVTCVHVTQIIKGQLEEPGKSTVKVSDNAPDHSNESDQDSAKGVTNQGLEDFLDSTDPGAAGEGGQLLTQAQVHSSDSLTADQPEQSGKERLTDTDTSLLLHKN